MDRKFNVPVKVTNLCASSPVKNDFPKKRKQA